ncbi:MAG: hypothetical protein ACPGNV_08950 [Mangrovicoccus sp.]
MHSASLIPPRDFIAQSPLSPEHTDCAIAVMLKILDGKCKMNPGESEIMAALYKACRHLPGKALGDGEHAIIDAAAFGTDEAFKLKIYERRVLAETQISRPVMKGFKAMLRQKCVLPAKT